MDFATARRKMVDNQARPNGVTDPRLIAAMLETPREQFVPAEAAATAYADLDVAIARGGAGQGVRFLLKPLTIARLLQAADVRESDHVLEVACGTGYASALLARLAASVVALDSDAALVDQAARTLANLGASNVSAVSGPLPAGWPAGAPYDLIVVNGAVEAAPETLFGQLKDGGRLVAIEGGRTLGKIMLYRRTADDVSGRSAFDAAAPALAAFAKPKAFVF